jgi:FkbM family methyltransferase
MMDDLLQEGLAMHRRGAVAEAVACYIKLLGSDPGNADAHYYLALIDCQHGRFTEGAERARKAIAADPLHAGAHALLGRALSALGQHNTAFVIFDRAIALNPEVAEPHSHKADVLSDLGRSAEAIESYERALALAPHRSQDWFNRGVTLLALDRQEDAITSFQRALTERSDFAEAHLQCAKALSNRFHYTKALEHIQKALSIDPFLAEAWLGQGNVLSALKQQEGALAAYDKALELKADMPEAWLGRANALRRLSRWMDAAVAHDRALALKSDFAEVRVGYGTRAEAHKREILRLALRSGVTIAVPNSLSALTTYVLLEQEEWFEKEVNFIRHFLKPGMSAVDIGANLGIYGLTMAHLVGPHGHVYCYEPGGEARSCLEESKILNCVDSLDINASALSDSRKEGCLAFAASSELRALHSSNDGELVQITNLDFEATTRHWPSIDFVKIDAEGEEERIIAGGRGFFDSHSPLVMFEIKAGNGINERLLALFPEFGYRLFRQLGGEPILVPHDIKESCDGYELNLFAAKPDRVATLAKEGLLVNNFAELVHQPIANESYAGALSAFATWRRTELKAEIRCIALAVALKAIRAECAHAITVERLATWARIANDWGARSESVGALGHLLQALDDGQRPSREPFLPVASRFDSAVVNAGEKAVSAESLLVSAAEQYERLWRFTSSFGGSNPRLAWLSGQKLASPEMLRRQTLSMAKIGRRPRVPERLCIAAPDHINADIWRSGMVPGTIV